MSAMLDTQMTDYGSDLDVLMQHNSDPWNQEDGTMEEDSFNSFNQASTSKSAGMDTIVPLDASLNMSLSAFSTVSGGKDDLTLTRVPSAVEEVDMEEYTDEPHEYDMLDAEEHAAQEIEDVEVHDAQPTVTTPAPVAPSPQQLAFSLSNQSTSSIHEVSAALITPEPSYGLSHESHLTSHDSTVAHESSFITQDHPVAPEAIDSSVSKTEPHDLHHETHNAPGTVPGTHEAVELADQDTQNASERTEQHELEHPEGARLEPPRSEDSDLLVPQQSAAPPEDAPQDQVLPELQQQTYLEEPHERVQDATGNPHEISEGVYIEPPPAVLVDIPSSGQAFTLFNQPSRSGHSTPHPDDQAVHADMPLLLQDRPTLFYEPLFSVFEALRQQNVFNEAAEIRDAELMFEVPSLRLFVSEDNVHAREVTLHDISILHDSFGEAGPLRLQLRFQAPRFLLRYAELQEHLHRTLLEEEQQDPVEHVGVDNGGENHDHQNEGSATEDLEQQQEQPEHVDLPEAAVHGHEEDDQPAPEAEPSEQQIDSSEHDAETLDGQNHDFQETEQVPDPEVEAESSDERHDSREHDEESEAETPSHEDLDSRPELDEAEDGSPESHNDDDSAHEQYDELEGDEYEENVDPEREGEEDYQEGEYDGSESSAEDHPGALEQEEDQEEDGVSDHAHEDEQDLDTPAQESEQFSSIEPIHEVEEAADFENTSTVLEATEEEIAEEAASLVESASEAVGTVHDGEHSTDDHSDTLSHSALDPDPLDEIHDFTELPELPDDDDPFWNEEDGEGDIDENWDAEQAQEHDRDDTGSSESSKTLSSLGTATKRAFSEVEGDDEDGEHDLSLTTTPDKRTRLEY